MFRSRAASPNAPQACYLNHPRRQESTIHNDRSVAPEGARDLASVTARSFGDGDTQDGALLRRMLEDSRSRVRAAGLSALARLDRAAARCAAIEVLDAGVTGRVAQVAADVLREGVPSRAESDVLARVALDASRPDGCRFRALSLLRPTGWLHLAVLLEADEQAGDSDLRRRLRTEITRSDGARLARAPAHELRARIERLLPTMDADRRRWIESLLRSSR